MIQTRPTTYRPLPQLVELIEVLSDFAFDLADLVLQLARLLSRVRPFWRFMAVRRIFLLRRPVCLLVQITRVRAVGVAVVSVSSLCSAVAVVAVAADGRLVLLLRLAWGWWRDAG